MYVSAYEVRAIADKLIEKGPAYAIGLLIYTNTPSSDYRYVNVVRTLEPAFGEDVANEVWSRIHESFKDINMDSMVRIEDEEEFGEDILRDYLTEYVLARDIKIIEERDKRYSKLLSDSEEVLIDRKVLSIACAVIEKFKGESDGGYPALSISTNPMGFIEVSSTDEEYFSKVVSSVLGLEGFDVRRLFCKYLLGFISDWSSHDHRYYSLVVYSFVIPIIKRLAGEVSKYVRIFTKAEVESIIRGLYENEDFLKLSVIDVALSNVEWPWQFLESFFGKPREVLRSETEIRGLISKGFINPLIYNNVKEILRSLYFEALGVLVHFFAKPFKDAGYDVSRSENLAAFTKPLAKPINVFFYPWPKEPHIPYESGTINVVVMQGIPSGSISNYLDERHGGALWLFTKEGKIVVIPYNYRVDVHGELLKILSKSFSIEFFGLTPEEARELMLLPQTTAGPHQAPPHVIKWINLARDVLEGVVAGAFEAFGFSVEVDKRVRNPRTGTEVEIDVWGEKVIEGARIIAYASCKNWNNPVEADVVRGEFGRLFQMPLIPHLRILVAPTFTDSAKKEAVANGFLVVEVGERASRENADKVYAKVYEGLNKLLVGVAPEWMQELAKKVRTLADEIRKIGDELERAGRPAQLRSSSQPTRP